MSDQSFPTKARVTCGIVTGVIAGTFASFAMDRFQAIAASLLPSDGGDEEPATQKAADAFAKGIVRHERCKPVVTGFRHPPRQA